MQSYDLYGLYSDDLDSLAGIIGQVLGITFIPHDSSYRGGAYYRFGTPGQEELILQRNYDEIDQEVVESEFGAYPFLLYVGPTNRSREIRERLMTQMKAKATLLRHKVF
jgi:hypothetical protein